jgi:hypothetical protein
MNSTPCHLHHQPLPYVYLDGGRQHAVPPKHCGCQPLAGEPPVAACFLVACRLDRHDAIARWLGEERQASVADLVDEGGVEAVYPLLELSAADLQVEPPAGEPAAPAGAADSLPERVRALLDGADGGVPGATGRFLVCESVESGIEVVDAVHREFVALDVAAFERLLGDPAG